MRTSGFQLIWTVTFAPPLPSSPLTSTLTSELGCMTCNAPFSLSATSMPPETNPIANWLSISPASAAVTSSRRLLTFTESAIRPPRSRG